MLSKFVFIATYSSDVEITLILDCRGGNMVFLVQDGCYECGYIVLKVPNPF